MGNAGFISSKVCWEVAATAGHKSSQYQMSCIAQTKNNTQTHKLRTCMLRTTPHCLAIFRRGFRTRPHLHMRSLLVEICDGCHIVLRCRGNFHTRPPSRHTGYNELEVYDGVKSFRENDYRHKNPKPLALQALSDDRTPGPAMEDSLNPKACSCSTGALIIRTGFWVPLYYTYNKEPLK